MTDREWQIALFGTFDVENYGDLLFPLIAEAELTARLGRVKLHRFSYNAKTPPAWPYKVTSLTELPRIAGSLDGALIGGGFIIRFDKDVAPEYGPPTNAIHHPTGYWLSPALIALQHGIPLIWNAPGMHCNEIPSWAEPLLELALAHSRHISVRDEPSQTALARFVDKSQIVVTPDTGFGVARLLGEPPSAEFTRLREASGLTAPYIVVQGSGGLEPFLCFAKKHSCALRDFRFVVLPIGPVLGDHEAAVAELLPGLVHLPIWPHPLMIAEVIGHAAAVVGHSYHLAITALAFGVPVFYSADLSVGKFTSLSEFETIFPLPSETETNAHWFTSRLGKTRPSSAVRKTLDRLADHWDRIATILREGPTATQPAVNRFWQTLPGLLENAETRHDALAAECQSKYADYRDRIDTLNNLLTLARGEIVSRDDRIAKLHSSPSWRVTAPARFLMRNLKRLVRK